MMIHQTLALREYPEGTRIDVLSTFFEAQTRVNMIYLIAYPETPPLYSAGVRYRREGSPEQWKDIPTILRDGHDDCEGLACWLAAELRVRKGITTAYVHLIRQRSGTLIHAIVADTEDKKRRWDPSRKLGMVPQRRRKAA